MHGVKRIFFDGEMKGVIELPEEESRRLKTVLRAESGDKVELLSKSKLALGEILSLGKRSILVRIDSARDIVKPDYKLTVYQCLAKREYMDMIIEKYAELGVTDIVPVMSSRSMRELKPNTISRYESILTDGALQSENEFIANIAPLTDIFKIKANHEENILFHERLGDKTFPKIRSRDIGLIIGPEGGFTEAETSMLEGNGFKSYTPIDCVLKAETAAILFTGAVRMAL